MRRVRGLILLLVGSATFAVGSTSAPAATTKYPCVFNDGYLCYYYSPNEAGSSIGVYGRNNDLLNPAVKFATSGAGQGQNVGNNSASACSNHGTANYNVYFGVNQTGFYNNLPPYVCRNFSPAMRNNDRSQLLY